MREVGSQFTRVWRFYEIQNLEMSGLRIGLLLRVLVVDALPFESMLTEIFRTGKVAWEERYGRFQLHFLMLMSIQGSTLSRDCLG